MSLDKTKKLVFTDSEEESGSESLKSLAAPESDEEDENSFEARQNIASSTHIEPKTKSKGNVKLELAGILRNIGVATKHSRAVKTIPWNKVNIEGYNQKELQKKLEEIIKTVGTVRTLDEILADYETNHQRYDFVMHPDHPTKPTSQLFVYIRENRSKFEKQLEKLNPDSKVTYTDVVKHAATKFNSLPENKKAIYINRYKQEKEDYKLKLKEFFEEHPEMKPKTKRRSRVSKEVLREPKVKSERASKITKSTVLTPFTYYREDLSKNGNQVALKVAQQMWKDLPNEEKGKYIAKVINIFTDREKKISKDELKIFETCNGLPERPAINSYNLFLSNFRKAYEGDLKNYIKNASKVWKDLSSKEKDKLQHEVDKLNASWKKKMQAYIKTLPADQQSIVAIKYNIFQTPSKKTKVEVANGKKGTSESESDAHPTEKITKRKLEESSEEEAQFELSKTKKRNESESDAVSPSKKKKKKNKTRDESSQEISPILPPSPKKKKIREPEYPSQSTAHYFMTKIYQGKPSKVAKAYKKLDMKQKSLYRVEMKKLRSAFLSEVKEYIKVAGQKDVEVFEKKIKDLKKAQNEELAWHESNGTDFEQSKKIISSDSDSDSDST